MEKTPNLIAGCVGRQSQLYFLVCNNYKTFVFQCAGSTIPVAQQ